MGPSTRPHFLACYTESARRLIVNADDLGMTRDINRAIVEGFEKGMIISATLVATADAFDYAVVRVSELDVRKPGFSVGCT